MQRLLSIRASLLGLYRIPYRVLTISPFTHINMKHWTVFKYHHLSQSLWLAIKVVIFFYWPFWRSLYLGSDIYFLKFNFMLLEKAYTSFKVSCPDHYTIAVGMHWVCLINEYEIFIIFLKEPKMFGAFYLRHTTLVLMSVGTRIELWN
jgi:hypothetical protein